MSPLAMHPTGRSTRPERYGDSLATELRHALADTLVVLQAIRSEAVECAFRTVPRHLFIGRYYDGGERLVRVRASGPTPRQLEAIYENQAHATHRRRGAPISSTTLPSLMADMLEHLRLEPGMRVLEIGAGTGWNAALIGHIVGPKGHVLSVDINPDVVKCARESIGRWSASNVAIAHSDAGRDCGAPGPFDRIIVTANCPEILPHWADQLAHGGKLVVPLRDIPGNVGCLLLSLTRGRSSLKGEAVSATSFMGLQGEDGTGREVGEPKALMRGLDALRGDRVPERNPLPWQRWALGGQTAHDSLQDLLFFARLEGMVVERVGLFTVSTSDRASVCLLTHDCVETYGTAEAYEALQEITVKWVDLGAPRRSDYRVEAWASPRRRRQAKTGWQLLCASTSMVLRLKPD